MNTDSRKGSNKVSSHTSAGHQRDNKIDIQCILAVAKGSKAIILVNMAFAFVVPEKKLGFVNAQSTAAADDDPGWRNSHWKKRVASQEVSNATK